MTRKTFVYKCTELLQITMGFLLDQLYHTVFRRVAVTGLQFKLSMRQYVKSGNK